MAADPPEPRNQHRTAASTLGCGHRHVQVASFLNSLPYKAHRLPREQPGGVGGGEQLYAGAQKSSPSLSKLSMGPGP